MDYLFCPPEVNSVRIYTGPGASSLLTAAGIWDSVSAELSNAAQGYESVTTNLSSLEWQGTASQAMAVAASQFITWLQSTAEQAKQTAMQARTVAAAFEQAHAMTIPPTAVATNRTRLAQLIATNYLGQNTGLIAQTDEQYQEYWAVDATAMSNYDTSASGATTQLPKFNSPNNNTNQSGVAAQNSSVAAANGTAAATSSAQQAISNVTNASPNVLGSTVSQALNPIIPEDATLQDEILAAFAGVNSTYNVEAFVSGVIGAANNLGVLPDLGAAAAVPAEIAPALASAPTAAGAGAGAGLGDISAVLARAGTIGPMSVPASWSAPSTTTIAALQPAGMTTLPGTEEAAASGYPGYPGMPGGVAGRGSGVGAPPRYGVRLTVMPRPPAAG